VGSTSFGLPKEHLHRSGGRRFNSKTICDCLKLCRGPPCLEEASLRRRVLEEPTLGTAVPYTSSLRSTVGIHRRLVPDILSIEVLRDLRALV